VRADDKPAALLWLVREGLPQGSSTLVFASTRHHVEFLHNLLSHEGVPAACVFGSMDQVGAAAVAGVSVTVLLRCCLGSCAVLGL
jgi:ATP-dependent RNA helicase DDX54/DBP10